jgi:serine/threonine protein kinase
LSAAFRKIAQAGGGDQGQETPDARVRRLLNESNFVVDENVMKYIHASGELASRMIVATTRDQAVSLYEAANRVPQSQTRAEVLENSNVKIDGNMPIHGPQTAMFLYAFEDDIPMVLKVPADAIKAHNECALFNALSQLTTIDNSALVPVKVLRLRGEHTTRFSPLRSFNLGILMPLYCCSLDNVPVPISTRYALKQGQRLRDTITFIHSHGWMHGDIKPGNIFLSNEGAMWLGDYGSACEVIQCKEKFSGGTLRYQCNELLPVAEENALKFDIMGLLLSLLDRLGMITLTYAPVAHNTIRNSINAVEDEELKAFLNELNV